MAEAIEDAHGESLAAKDKDVLPAEVAWSLGAFGHESAIKIAFPLEVGGAGKAHQHINIEEDCIADVESSARAELWTEIVGMPEDAEGAGGIDADTFPTSFMRKRPLNGVQRFEDTSRSESNPFPALRQYVHSCGNKNKNAWRLQSKRYFAQHEECSDDGHVSRWAARMLCLVCLDLTHQMRDCPHARCGLCFETGHGALECPNFQEHETLQETLAEQHHVALTMVGGEAPATGSGDGEHVSGMAIDDGSMINNATMVVEVRCVVCRVLGCGHANCSPPPASFAPVEGGSDHPPAAMAAREGFFAADDAAAAFGHWAQHAESSPASSMWIHVGNGAHREHHCHISLETSVLRVLGGGPHPEKQWQDVLANAPAAAVTAAARGLNRIRALVPGISHGHPPQVTPLGWWLSHLSVPPFAAHALLHGALWGVLLPVAVVVVLLESAPPDLALSDGTTPPRKSGHFALVAAYFRWREGRETSLSRRFGADFFWEVVDQRVVAICKHAQSALGYDGDDAAFEEMDGELMDVRRNDGRPWTLASAVGGSEASARWSRFCAALAAAFPPQLDTSKNSDCVIRTRFGEGSAQVETVVNSGYAVLFAAGELATSGISGMSSGEVRLDGARGTLCGGEGALEEALAIRQQLCERLDQAIESVNGAEGTTPIASVMDEADVAQVLNYLRGSAGQLVMSVGTAVVGGCSGSPRHSETALSDVGDSVLKFLGYATGGATETVGAEDSDTGRDAKRHKHDSITAQESAALQLPSHCTLTRPQAAIGRDLPPSQGGKVDVRADMQASEFVAGEAEIEEEVVCINADSLGRWAVALAFTSLLRVLKRRAVVDENYDLASQLKIAEAAAMADATTRRSAAAKDWASDRAAVLERLSERKRKAIADEDYSLAAKLKRRENELVLTDGPLQWRELERLLSEKADAVANEDYDRAAILRRRQSELEVAQRAFKSTAEVRAVALVADSAGRAEVLRAATTAQVQLCQTLSLSDGIWPEVQAELRRGSGNN